MRYPLMDPDVIRLRLDAVEEVKEKIMGGDQSAVRSWAKAEKLSEVAVESTQQLVQKDLLLD